MERKFRLSYDLLDKLSDEEIRLLVELAPKNLLLEHIKKRQKIFKDDIRGLRLDLKSNVLLTRMPKIFFDRLRAHDQGVIELYEFVINRIIQRINNISLREDGNKDFLEEAVLSRDIDIFSQLLDTISEILRPEYFKLFFKLIGQKLEDTQLDYIDEYCLRKELESEILKEIEDEYNERVRIFEERIRKVQGRLNESKAELHNEKKENKLLKNEIERITLQKEEYRNVLNLRIDELVLKSQELDNERAELESQIKSKDEIIDELDDILNSKLEDFNIIAQEKWEKANRGLLNNQEQLRIECRKLKKTRENASENIRILELRRQELENELSKYEKAVSDFIDNIDKKIIEKALNDSLLNYSMDDMVGAKEHGSKDIGLYIKENKVSNKIDECKNMYDFAENIAINLENIGVVNITDEIASYIIGILGAGLTPLICGYKARDIATAISISYSGETPYIVSLPNGYANPKEIVDIYNMAKSNVILIEDAVGTMNENALMPLLRERTQNGSSSKLLLLAAENMDSIKYMPLNMYNQVALVIIDKFTIRKGNFQASDARKVFKEFISLDISNNEYKRAQKSVRRLLRDLHMGSPYEVLRTSIVMHSTRLSNSNIALKGYLRSELLFLCQCHNIVDILTTNAQNHRLEDNLAGVLRSGIHG